MTVFRGSILRKEPDALLDTFIDTFMNTLIHTLPSSSYALVWILRLPIAAF